MKWIALLLPGLLFASPAQAFTLLTYNVKGNGVADWSTNSAQVQAIGRQVAYLQPDVITFNEIPRSKTHEMTNFVQAFLPGYYLATNSGTDNFIRSVIASRHPIVRSESWLARSSLTNFGYDGVYTRDLFEAEIQIPGASEPMHVFTTHLKSNTSADDCARRAAEASAVSNFLVTVFRPATGNRPYVLTGDLNEDIARPPSASKQPIERLSNPATGLFLTTPLNPVLGNELTFNVRTDMNRRLDYILPGGLLFSNIVTNIVFRTDVLNPLPPGVQAGDMAAASDHAPVLTVFNYPDPPLAVSMLRSNQTVHLQWPSLAGRRYRVEVSQDLAQWSVLEAGIDATTTTLQWSADSTGDRRFFRVVREP